MSAIQSAGVTPPGPRLTNNVWVGHSIPQFNSDVTQYYQEASSWLHDLNSSRHRFRPTQRAVAARPFGLYPDEVAQPIDVGVESFHEALAAGNIEEALEALHCIVEYEDHLLNATSAPLHSFLPREMSLQLMESLTFELVDWYRGHPEADHEPLVEYLSHLEAELIEREKQGETHPRTLARTYIYSGDALDVTGDVNGALDFYERAEGMEDASFHIVNGDRHRLYTGFAGLYFKRALVANRVGDKKGFEREVNAIARARSRYENLDEQPGTGKRENCISLRLVTARHFWNLDKFDMAIDELHGIEAIHGNVHAGRMKLNCLIDGLDRPDSYKARLKRLWFSEDGSIRSPDEVHIPWWLRVRTWVRNAVFHQQGTVLSTIGTAGIGFVAGGGLTYAVSGGEASVPAIAVGTGVGGAVVEGGVRLIRGAMTPQARSAVSTGIDAIGSREMRNASLRFAAGRAAVVAVGTGAGVIDGPGTWLGQYLHSTFGTAPGIEHAHAAQGGFIDNSQFLSTARSAVHGYTDGAMSLVDGRFGDRMATVVHNFAHAHPAQQALGIMGAASLAGYLGPYLFSKKFRNWLIDTHTEHRRARYYAEIPIFLSAMYAAGEIAAFFGGDPGYAHLGPVQLPLNMMGVATISAGLQAAKQYLYGARGPTLELGPMISEALIKSAMVGITVNFIPIHESVTTLDRIGEVMGKTVALVPLTVLKGAMQLSNWKRFFQNELIGTCGYTQLAWLARLSAGPWDAWYTNLLGGGIEYLFKPTVQSTFTGGSGSEPQRASFERDVNGSGGVATPALVRAQDRALERIPVDIPFRKDAGWQRVTYPGRAIVAAVKGGKIVDDMYPEEYAYDLHYQSVRSGRLTTDGVNALIGLIRIYYERGDRAKAFGIALALAAGANENRDGVAWGLVRFNRKLFLLAGVHPETAELPEDAAERRKVFFRKVYGRTRAALHAPVMPNTDDTRFSRRRFQESVANHSNSLLSPLVNVPSLQPAMIDRRSERP